MKIKSYTNTYSVAWIYGSFVPFAPLFLGRAGHTVCWASDLIVCLSMAGMSRRHDWKRVGKRPRHKASCRVSRADEDEPKGIKQSPAEGIVVVVVRPRGWLTCEGALPLPYQKVTRELWGRR